MPIYIFLNIEKYLPAQYTFLGFVMILRLDTITGKVRKTNKFHSYYEIIPHLLNITYMDDKLMSL